MACVEICDGDHLLITHGFGGEAPRGGRAYEEHLAEVRKVHRDGNRRPRDVHRATEPKIENLDRRVWPARGNRTAAEAILKGRNIRLE